MLVVEDCLSTCVLCKYDARSVFVRHAVDACSAHSCALDAGSPSSDMGLAWGCAEVAIRSDDYIGGVLGLAIRGKSGG